MIDLFNLYAWIMRLRRWLYRVGVLRSVAIGTPVISVGNLSAGGTGKTPFTLYLVRKIQTDFCLKCAVVLRGYKRESTGLLIVRDWNGILANTRRSGDEAQLYANELRDVLVICDEDRVRGARMAREMGAEVIVLDDGFQHLRLRRDLNILLINALEGIPNVLPFGRGREGASASSSADLIVVTNAADADNDANEISSYVADRPMIASRTRIIRIRTLGDRSDNSEFDVTGKIVLALSGIGMPQGFEDALRSLGAIVIALRFPDHTSYDDEAFRMIEQTAIKEHCDMIVTTTKDEVKLTVLLPLRSTTLPFFVAESRLVIERGEDVLNSMLTSLFGKTIQ